MAAQPIRSPDSDIEANAGNALIVDAVDSQTQEETQLAVPPPGIGDRERNGSTDERKRKGTADDTVKTSKKIKISVGPAVDLGD